MTKENKNAEINSKKKGKKFGFYLAIMISFLIAAAIIFTAFYSTKGMTRLMRDFRETYASYENLISKAVVKSFTLDIKNGNFAATKDTIEFLKRNGYIGYAYAYDKNADSIIWASESSLMQQKNSHIMNNILPLVNQEQKIQQRELQLGPYNFVIGLSPNKLDSKGYQSMFDNLKYFIILFLFIGVLISAIISKMINKPLMNLVLGVQEFGKGNFEYRLKESGFEEIDELVGAYNRMSSQLCELYESLEAKVEERTKELELANIKLKETQTMMVHSEKMRSLGELVAGIAHEINNPINFIYGNIMILDNYQKDLMTLIDKYAGTESQIDPASLKDINDFKQKVDMEFLRDDIGDLIKSCMEGVERTKNIILDLKNFSRMDEMVFSECNIPKEIDTTLNILNNKIKNRVTVHKDYEENLPKIEAYGGQINQVFMNILDNAQSAIKGTGDIYISAARDGENIAVKFKDTGCGIKPEDLNKIFEPFYTTKPVGQGTGLGMSIAYRVIEAHSGQIKVESVVNEGTTITIVLPINHKIKDKEP